MCFFFGFFIFSSLNQSCCLLRIQPSEQDLSDHVSLLCQAMKADCDLTKSKVIFCFGLGHNDLIGLASEFLLVKHFLVCSVCLLSQATPIQEHVEGVR